MKVEYKLKVGTVITVLYDEEKHANLINDIKSNKGSDKLIHFNEGKLTVKWSELESISLVF